MLVGTVYLFKTMPTGFIPSQDSGFMFGVVMGPQDISFESHGAHAPEAAVAQPRRDANVGGVRRAPSAGREQPGVRLRHDLKPRDQRALSVDQIIEELRPKFMADPGRLHLHAESAAHHRQRPVRHQRLSAHAAEPDLEDIYTLGAATDGQDARSCPASWT